MGMMATIFLIIYCLAFTIEVLLTIIKLLKGSKKVVNNNKVGRKNRLNDKKSISK
jgi:hypothetical protein